MGGKTAVHSYWLSKRECPPPPPHPGIWIILQSFWIWNYVLYVDHVSSQIVTNISESSLLSQLLFGPRWRKILAENYNPYISPYFLLVGLLFQCVSPEKYLYGSRYFVNWCRFAISNDKSTKSVSSLFCFLFIHFYLRPVLASGFFLRLRLSIHPSPSFFCAR